MGTVNKATHRRPPGVTLSIGKIVGKDANQVPVTVGERILQAVRTGSFRDAAALSAGAQPWQLNEWLKRGATAATKAAAGERLNSNEKMYARFADEFLQAEGEMEVLAVEQLHGLMMGPVKTVKVEKTTAAGVVETTVRTETLPADAQALQWWLERRHASRWNRRQQLELTGSEGGPIVVDSPLNRLLGQFEAMNRRAAANEDALPTTVAPEDVSRGDP